MIFPLKKVIFFFVLLTPSLVAQQINLPEIFNEKEAAKSIQEHTEFLASDDLEGRGTGTVGGNLAAEYIAGEFANMGIKPSGNENTFYQNIPMHGSFPLKSSELKIFFGDQIMMFFYQAFEFLIK